MAQLTLSKSTYLKESRKLDNYRRFLPSLDLKRKQLIIEKKNQERLLEEVELELADLLARVPQELPMLGNEEVSLDRLVVVDSIELSHENLVGIKLPVLRHLHVKRNAYGYLVRPHWVDVLVRELERASTLQVKVRVFKRRVEILKYALKKATQRVNLLEKVLIPQTQKNMRRIEIFLSDNERAAVIRSKIAKRKRQAQENHEGIESPEVAR